MYRISSSVKMEREVVASEGEGGEEGNGVGDRKAMNFNGGRHESNVLVSRHWDGGEGGR